MSKIKKPLSDRTPPLTPREVEARFASATMAGLSNKVHRTPQGVLLRPLTANLYKGFRLLRPRSVDRRSSYAILRGQLRHTNG